MNKICVSVFMVVFIGISFTPMAANEDCVVNSYFASPSRDDNIESRIIEAIEDAQSTLLIAMYSFTDDQLGQAVIDAFQRGVRIEVILDDGQDSEQGGREWSKLVEAGIPVTVEHKDGLLHHMFAVVDSDLVITGSYNWTDRADSRNYENVVFIRCSKIAISFREEFRRIWDDISPSASETGKESEACSKCLEKLNIATYIDYKGVKGIGADLAKKIVDTQPFFPETCTDRSDLESIFEKIERIGPIKARDIVRHFCPKLYQS